MQESNYTVSKIFTNEIKSTADFKPRRSQSKHIYESKKTHIDKMVCANEFEKEICKILDNHKHILSWTKADMVGFFIPYVDEAGIDRQYRPDFIIHLENGLQLILEGKGEKRDHEIKKAAAIEWVNAVNQDKPIWRLGIYYCV